MRFALPRFARLPLFAGLVLLSACSGGTGGGTGEDRALNDAAASLDANSVDPDAADDANVVDIDDNGDQPQ